MLLAHPFASFRYGRQPPVHIISHDQRVFYSFDDTLWYLPPLVTATGPYSSIHISLSSSSYFFRYSTRPKRSHQTIYNITIQYVLLLLFIIYSLQSCPTKKQSRLLGFFFFAPVTFSLRVPFCTFFI